MYTSQDMKDVADRLWASAEAEAGPAQIALLRAYEAGRMDMLSVVVEAEEGAPASLFPSVDYHVQVSMNWLPTQEEDD